MANLRAQVVFQGKSNKPEDVFVNTYHFSSASTGQAAAEVVRDHLVELYNVAAPAPGSGALALSLSNVISRAANASKIKVYDLADVQPRIPIQFSWTLGPSESATAIELPAEVAICASLYSEFNRPRFRGRVYLGPWLSIQEDEPTTDRSRPPAVIRQRIASTFRRLIDKGANTQNLAIWSTVDQQMRVVTSGWVDDAWDIQRRRGQDAAIRTLI